MINRTKSFAPWFLLALPLLVFAQDPDNGSGSGRMLSPKDEAAFIKFSSYLEEMKDLHKAGKLHEALEEAAKAVKCLPLSGWNTFTPLAHEIAAIYMEMDMPEKALEAYRDGYQWSCSESLGCRFGTVNGSAPDLPSLFLVDYTLALANYKSPEMAQMIFYSEILSYDRRPFKSVPPILLTFEPDANGDYWEYSQDRLHAAMLVLNVVNTSSDSRNELKKASELFPEWYYPYVLSAMLYAPHLELAEREQLLDTAVSKARTDRERQWVEDVRRIIRMDSRYWTKERIVAFEHLWPDALNSVQTYQTKWAELRANWREYGVERAQMFANGGG